MNEQIETRHDEGFWGRAAARLTTERDSLRAQLLAAQGAMEAMRESMGEEWEQDELDITGDDQPPYCRECAQRAYDSHGLPNIHYQDCKRGNFFALTPATGSAWAGVVDAAEKALSAIVDHIDPFYIGREPRINAVAARDSLRRILGGKNEDR